MRSIHNIALLDGSTPAMDDRLQVAFLKVANVIGGGAGLAVTVDVTFDEDMPADYQVHAEPDQDAVCYASAKTSKGFTLNMSPRLAADTLAAGFVNLLVVG